MLRRFNWKSLLFIVAVVGLSLAALLVQNIDLRLAGARFQRGSDNILGLRLGLDLAGGSHLLYQACSTEIPADGVCPPENRPTDHDMEVLLSTITRRVNRLGVSEPVIQRFGDDRVIVQLPGIEDIETAEETLGRTAQLEIVERICHTVTCEAAGEFEDRPTGLTGDDLASVSASTDQATGLPIILFQVSPGAASRTFADLTQRLYESFLAAGNTQNRPINRLAYKLDGEVLVAPIVTGPIISGSGQIRGEFTIDEVRSIVISLDEGRLPIDIHKIASSVVSPSLGVKSLEDSLVAGVIGLALVLFFMVVYYRLAGVVATLALACYVTIVLAVFKLFPVTLTLAGVAGFILSLGMAVDANVLIFERLKEELRMGRTLQLALQIGFNRAWSAIRDGNVSTLIIAGILFFFGQQTANSAVTGFAIVLSLGVLTSMFTAIAISRSLLTFVLATPLRRLPSLFSPEGAGRAEALRTARRTS